jgi:hypothetical protein
MAARRPKINPTYAEAVADLGPELVEAYERLVHAMPPLTDDELDRLCDTLVAVQLAARERAS